jgi:hypothetical protein
MKSFGQGASDPRYRRILRVRWQSWRFLNTSICEIHEWLTILARSHEGMDGNVVRYRPTLR